MGRRIVAALGGNAILQPGQRGTPAEQRESIALASAQLADLVAAGHQLVLTHGNGPQVGNLLLQNEAAKSTVEPMPLDILVAMTQGMIGYMFQQSLSNQLRARGIDQAVVSLVTQVEVDPADLAFTDPTKPVGPFYSKQAADEVAAERGYIVKEDSARGWRRVVPSPEPRRVIEQRVITDLLEQRAIVIACGGGGVPVRSQGAGKLAGVEAVIDKDRAAVVLAHTVNADMLIILTDVPNVKLHYGTPDEISLGEVSVEQMQAYLKEGHFGAGSMGPKVASALDFVRNTGKVAAITSLGQAVMAAEGKAGTLIRS